MTRATLDPAGAFGRRPLQPHQFVDPGAQLPVSMNGGISVASFAIRSTHPATRG